VYLFGAIRKKYLLFVVGFVSTMFLFTIFGGRGLIQIYHLKEEKERIKIVNARLREENQKLAEQIKRMKHSKEEVEKIAREELGLVKKGEVVYQFER
jgi:cell division protein FtsB